MVNIGRFAWIGKEAFFGWLAWLLDLGVAAASQVFGNGNDSLGGRKRDRGGGVVPPRSIPL